MNNTGSKLFRKISHAKSVFLKSNQKVTLPETEPLIKNSEPGSFNADRAVLLTKIKIIPLESNKEKNERLEPALINDKRVFLEILR